MPTHHIVIACMDEPEAHRKKQGDILEVRPIEEVLRRGGWGRMETSRFMMLPVSGLTETEAVKLKAPMFEDGSFGELANMMHQATAWAENMDISAGQIINVDGWGYLATGSGNTGGIQPSFAQKYDGTVISNGVEYKCLGKFDAAKIGKARYSIPLEILKGWKYDLDITRVEDKSRIYQPFIDNGIVIDFAEKVAVVKDKIKGTFKYKTQKQAV